MKFVKLWDQTSQKYLGLIFLPNEDYRVLMDSRALEKIYIERTPVSSYNFKTTSSDLEYQRIVIVPCGNRAYHNGTEVIVLPGDVVCVPSNNVHLLHLFHGWAVMLNKEQP